MTTIRVDKSEAASRQLDVAIKMLFSGGEPLAVHALASAAYSIIRDLAENAEDAQWHENIKQMIVPGKEDQFWAHR